MAQIGPALPPGFKQSHSESDSDSESKPKDNTTQDSIDRYIGPVLPPGFSQQHHSDASADSSADSSDSESENVKHNTDRRDNIGPALPPSCKKGASTSRDQGPSSSSLARGVAGPSLPPGFATGGQSSSDEYDDSDLVGPVPHVGPVESGSVAADFERRAQRMKDRILDKDKDEVQERETWMLELPPTMGANLGLGPRKFRAGAGGNSCGDRSVWTDTPEDREKRAKDAAEGKTKKRKGDDAPIVSQRDQYLAEQVEEYNKTKRAKSLMEMHEEKLKKKKVPTATLR